jgi:poly(hydroxyalkanoate) depolymerase family esterase
MILDLSARIAEAMRLTRAGRLGEATALLQGLPRRRASPENLDALDRELTSTAFRGEQAIDMAPSRSGSESWTASDVDAQQRTAPGAGWGRARMPETAEFLARFGKGGSGAVLWKTADGLRGDLKPPVPDGARYEERSYANAAGRRKYKLFVPSCYRREPLPLIVMLHGCKQSSDDFAVGTRMNELAEEQGFLVAYPAQPSSANPSKCWNWFNADDQLRDRGEPSLIAGITGQVMRELAVDATRVYIAGLSAGGAAAAIMGARYPELYAAICVHSGLACGAAKDLPSAFAAMRQGGSRLIESAKHPLPTIVFHGDRDHTVNPSNGDQIIAQSRAGMQLHRTISRSQSAGGISYTRIVQTDASRRSILEQWVLHRAGHAWSGGSPAGSYTDPRGPDASREMLRFFFEQSKQPPAVVRNLSASAPRPAFGTSR